MMISKKKTGIWAAAVLMLLVVLFTIKISGHRHSLGILVLGLFCVYLIAALTGAIFLAMKIIKSPTFYLFMTILIVSFSSFFVYHQSYDSYSETRSLFWGFNGE